MYSLIAIAIGIGLQTLVISLGLIGISNALHDLEAELRRAEWMKMRTKER